MSLPSWSLVVTLRGPAEMAVPFIAHHLETGVDRIHVYLDSPDPGLEALLAGHPRVVLTVCNALNWRMRHPVKGRPDLIVPRQIANLADVRRKSRSDWIVHFDSDEFLHEDVPLAEELAAVPADVDWLRIQNVERVLAAAPGADGDQGPATIFDGLYRSPLPAPQARRIWGEEASFLTAGFSAYVEGKIALRRTSPLKMVLHRAIRPGQGLNEARANETPHVLARGVRLRHLDGWTPLHWVVKLMMQIEAGHTGGHTGRRAQLAYMRADPVTARGVALYDRIQRLDAGRLAALRRAGALHDLPLDPRPAIARHFPQIGFSYSLADFDARLRAANPAFFARHRL